MADILGTPALVSRRSGGSKLREGGVRLWQRGSRVQPLPECAHDPDVSNLPPRNPDVRCAATTVPWRRRGWTDAPRHDVVAGPDREAECTARRA